MADPVVTELANRLAEDCLAVQAKTGDDRLFMQVGDVLGASSQTLEEAFLTAIRTRMADQQGRAFLKRKLAEHQARTGSE
jgi:O-methyltransferase involved in polyketide biosynthesis